MEHVGVSLGMPLFYNLIIIEFMDSLSNYRQRALQSLEGNWGNAVIVTVIYLLIASIFQVGLESVLPFSKDISKWSGGLLSILVLVPIGWGFLVYFLRLVRHEKLGVKDLFAGFSDYARVLLAMLLKTVYILLWTLLLILPGIYKSLSYALTEYVLLDHPEMNGEQAIRESMRLMRGKELELFLLGLTFIGWAILAIIPFGLGFIFLIPYMQTALAHFYEDAVKEDRGAIEL
uniref:DUF975 family protein n=1 Tax=Prevotella sp. GTC17259 TaxID=3236795 RepID=A0AB33J2X0_9BACT